MARILVSLAAVFLLATAVQPSSGEAGPVEARTERQMLTLDNGTLQVRYDTQTGTFTARRGDRLFITTGRLVGPKVTDSVEANDGADAGLIDVADSLGSGTAIEVTWPDGRIRRLALYESLPFICVTAAIRNTGTEPISVRQVTPLVAVADAGAPMSQLRGFGPEGSHELADKTHFCFAAAADPKTRAGVVCGWLSHYRASGVVSVRAQDRRLVFEGRSEYGRLLVPPHTTAPGETLAIGWFDDALDGLEAYAAGCAKAHQILLPDKVPSGYCTWYHAGASDQEKTAELADFAGKELKKYGFDFVQIDDGWQIGSRDFTTYNPRGRYADGIKRTSEKITGAGLVGGIWFIPFGWDPNCDALAGHSDWLVKRPDGSVYSVHWAGSCLDMTHPEARKFLRDVVQRITRDWGYKYIKIDGLWSGMAVKILYPSPAYRDDEIGSAVLHDPSQTQVEAYRAGLQLVREAAGDDVFILGCNIAQNARTLGASFGLVDGMRIGHDIGARWDAVRGCAVPTSHFYFFHHKVWFNDPDCLMLRDPLTLDQARAWGSLLALSGQMNVVSEWLPGLPPDRLDVVKRTMPNHGGLGRPVDLLENDLPTVWHYRARLGEERIDLVGLFNWDENQPARLELDPAMLGLPALPDDRYVGFDYWEDTFVGPFSGKCSFDLRPSSCRVIAVQRLQRHPQLVGTSRHVTQGPIDVAAVAWDPERRTLSGRSQVVGEDPYELRLLSPEAEAEGLHAVEAHVSGVDQQQAGVTVSVQQTGPQVRVVIESPQCGEVAWSVRFE
ncbi:MAG: alpha-galactosidase [Pirellulales bacterium]|nr:alpha-galactosidase [Pirellulales bacterium]